VTEACATPSSASPLDGVSAGFHNSQALGDRGCGGSDTGGAYRGSPQWTQHGASILSNHVCELNTLPHLGHRNRWHLMPATPKKTIQPSATTIAGAEVWMSHSAARAVPNTAGR
jgi:hypothetical protein